MNEICPVRKTINDYGEDANGKIFLSRAAPYYQEIYELKIEDEIWASKKYLINGDIARVPRNHICMDWEALEEEIKKVKEMALNLERTKESQLVQN